ncbi:MAG: murein biosynthesis integral membrane protein MurJ [Chloroflexi bacterium]|nr:murein biosynthesis integral membrane protein MurJ [Chloroflexota bacterium]
MQLSIAQASLLMIGTLVASRILGWLRLSVIGAQFAGEPRELDAFLAAFRIPDTIFNLLVAGALASAFIPVFSGYLAKEREREAWRVASSVMNAMLVGLIALSALMWVAAPYLVPLMAPNFDDAQLVLMTDLTRVMLLSPIFMGLSALFTGVLNSYRQFLSGATAPLVYNAVIILFAFFGAPFLGIRALAYGVVAGAAMMWLVQVPELTFRRTRYALSLDLSHPGVREIARLAWPRTIALAVVQVTLFVDVNLASRMAPGSYTALLYAFQLTMLPLGVFSIAISAAVFPTLTRFASLGQPLRMREALEQAVRWIMFLTLPTIIVMIVLRRPIVNLLFQYGEFGDAAREATALAFLFYSLGLVGHALVQILARAYFATKDSTTPLVMTTVSIVLNVVLAIALAPPLGINGLALANSIATLAEATLMLFVLAPRARLRLGRLSLATLRHLAASLSMGVAMFLFIRVTNLPLDLALNPPKGILFVQTAIAMAFGLGVYVAASTLFRAGELTEMLAFVRSRSALRRGPPDERG